MFCIKILILGATGVVGFHFARELRKKHSVVTASRSSPGTDFRIDASDNASLERLIIRNSPDVVVNAVKPPMPADEMEANRELAYALNVRLPSSLAALQEKRAFRLLHISSDWVYAGREGAIYTEESETGPLNYYAETKLLAERAIADAGGNFLILRTEGVFGYDERGSNFLLRLRNSGVAGKKVFAASDQFSQPISGAELARLAAALIGKGTTGLFNCTGSEYVSRLEFAQRACKFFGFDAEIESCSANDRKMRIPQYLRVDNSKVERLAGRIKTLDAQFKDILDAGLV